MPDHRRSRISFRFQLCFRFQTWVTQMALWSNEARFRTPSLPRVKINAGMSEMSHSRLTSSALDFLYTFSGPQSVIWEIRIWSPKKHSSKT